MGTWLLLALREKRDMEAAQRFFLQWNSPVFVKSENQEIEHSKSWFSGSFEPARMKTRRGRSTVELHTSRENLASLHGLHKIGSRPATFLLGSGLVLSVAWVGSTVVGRILGDVIHDSARFGLDFAFTAVFLALLVGLWKGKSDLFPWVVAVAAAHFLPGKWYILFGGLAGSIAGVVRQAD